MIDATTRLLPRSRREAMRSRSKLGGLLRLKLAAHPIRLEMLLLLHGGEQDFRQICQRFQPIGIPSASQHLTSLRKGDLITSRRQGRVKVYLLTEIGVRFVEAIGRIFHDADETPIADRRIPCRAETSNTSVPANVSA